MWTDATHTYDGVIQTPEFLAAYQAEFAYRNATACALVHLAPAPIKQARDTRVRKSA